MKWSYFTSKEEIIYLIKVFPSKSFSQSELKCQRKIELIKRTLQGPPGRTNAEGDEENGDKGGRGRKRHSKSPPQNHFVEWPLLLFSAHHPTTSPLPKRMYTQTHPHRESLVPKKGLEGGRAFLIFVFVAL